MSPPPWRAALHADANAHASAIHADGSSDQKRAVEKSASGIVISYTKSKGFGFVQEANGKEHFFPACSRHDESIEPGDKVSFHLEWRKDKGKEQVSWIWKEEGSTQKRVRKDSPSSSAKTQPPPPPARRRTGPATPAAPSVPRTPEVARQQWQLTRSSTSGFQYLWRRNKDDSTLAHFILDIVHGCAELNGSEPVDLITYVPSGPLLQDERVFNEVVQGDQRPGTRYPAYVVNFWKEKNAAPPRQQQMS